MEDTIVSVQVQSEASDTLVQVFSTSTIDLRCSMPYRRIQGGLMAEVMDEILLLFQSAVK
jgi:hypothetical protein